MRLLRGDGSAVLRTNARPWCVVNDDPVDLTLPDGVYQLRIFASKVMGAGGTLDGNSNGVSEGSPTDDYTTPTTSPGRIIRLFGDSDGNAVVNAFDFSAFRLAFGGYAFAFDYDGNNVTDAADFTQFRSRFGSSLP